MAKQKSVWEGTIQRHEYREGNFDHQLANSLSVDMFNMDEILINKQRKKTKVLTRTDLW